MSDHEFHKPAHKGYWIPVELDRFDLSTIEKLFLSILDSLDDPEKHCFASNAYLAEKMGLSTSRITFYLTKFKRMGLIEQVSFSGRQRILRVCKEKWYAKEIKNSKKESCVKTSRQTSCFQVGRLRENTHHIIKPIEKLDRDDDEPAEAGNGGTMTKMIVFRHKTKNVVSKRETAIYEYLISKGYFESEIKTALAEADECNPLLKADNHNVIERYISAMIDKQRDKTIREKKINDSKQRTQTRPHNSQQDLIQRSREDFRKEINHYGCDAR